MERVSPVRLQRWLSSDRPPYVLDVRDRAERAIASLPGDHWIVAEEVPERIERIPRQGSVVVYDHCDGTAERIAELLVLRGHPEVGVLVGGIDAYSREVDPTTPRYTVPIADGPVVQQFPNVSTGCLSYLLSDPSTDDAIVVDPALDVRPYLAALHRRKLTLRAIVETHTHADHLSGHAALRERTDAPIWVSRRSRAEYPHRPLSEGVGLSFGRSELTVLETPGHTLDHLSLRFGRAVLTGDTLLPGSCGRTDLGDGDAGLLWESLTDKLLRLPETTEVLPAHYGALHGLPPPPRYSSTIGLERRSNEALLQPDRGAFLRYMTEGWPPKPTGADAIVRENLVR